MNQRVELKVNEINELLTANQATLGTQSGWPDAVQGMGDEEFRRIQETGDFAGFRKFSCFFQRDWRGHGKDGGIFEVRPAEKLVLGEYTALLNRCFED